MDASQHEPPDDPDRPKTGSLVFDIVDPHRHLEPDQRRSLESTLGEIARLLAGDGAAGQVRVGIVNDETMAELHERHTGVAGTTDVLTFDLAQSGPSGLDVDLTLCIDQARRESQRRGLPIIHELLLYTIHGVLHCTGYDDHEQAGDFGAQAMHQREDEILRTIGIGPIYAAPERGGPR